MPEPVTAGVATVAAGRLIGTMVSGLSKRLSSSIANLTSGAADQLAVALGKGFSEYLDTSYNKCRVFKSILNPSEPLRVLDHYVHVTLTCGNKKLPDDELIKVLPTLNCVIVTGLAGCGKSMFMRYLTLRNFEDSRGTIPLFVELRRLNNLTNIQSGTANKTLLTFIRNECTSRMSVISENQFDLGLKGGAFLLILDGFDELNHDIREALQQQILSIRKDFPATNLIISSRPDDRFASWSEFHVYRVDQLSKEQAVQLVESLPYGADVKKRFVREVQDRLYQSHTSFLSSPLLATIMLLTFEGFAECLSGIKPSHLNRLRQGA